jgi:alpha-ketoglutarate-dependent taurine dioxygenase
MVTARLSDSERTLPLVVTPENGAQENRTLARLLKWIGHNRATFDAWLYKHGALLFRGFSVESPEEFESFAQAVEPELANYIEGDSPRHRVSGKVYTSTEYPSEYEISLHNELSYAHKWPHKLFFFCDVPPEQRGETPLVDCREVLAALEPDLRERFIQKKVKYVHNLHGGFGIGKSWQETFETTDKAEVERYLRAGGVEYRWKSNGGLWMSQVREAIAVHPVTEEPVWFNQAEQWHSSQLDPETLEAFFDLGLGEEELPHSVFYGDGSAIDPDDLQHIRSLMRQRAIFFPWQKSDLLVIDNMLAAHGRNPYEGLRRILVAMA